MNTFLFDTVDMTYTSFNSVRRYLNARGALNAALWECSEPEEDEQFNKGSYELVLASVEQRIKTWLEDVKALQPLYLEAAEAKKHLLDDLNVEQRKAWELLGSINIDRFDLVKEADYYGDNSQYELQLSREGTNKGISATLYGGVGGLSREAIINWLTKDPGVLEVMFTRTEIEGMLALLGQLRGQDTTIQYVRV